MGSEYNANRRDSTSSTPASSVYGESRKSRRTLSVQEKVIAKILSQVGTEDLEEQIEEAEEEVVLEEKAETKAEKPHVPRPGFSLPKLNLNLIELNQRLGALFESQDRFHDLLTWVHPVHTLCLLAVWMLICLNPHLLPAIPLLAQCYLIMLPAFLARHPVAKNDPRQTPINFGPPTAPPVNIRAVAVVSRDFVRNMRDLQKSMDELKKAHDAVATYVVPQFNFSDEARTTEIFNGTLILAVFAFMTIHLVPWPTVLLIGGSVGIIAGHPAVKEILHNPEAASNSKQRIQDLLKTIREFIEDDCILDETPPVRQVEVFELQRHHPETDTWESWLFSPTPYDPLSPARLAGSRPKGTQFFQDVMPPAAWRWKHKKWSLDRNSTQWVQDRMITGVEVETTGEMWVYDIPAEDEEQYVSAMSASTSVDKDKAKAVAKSGWEEASGVERRGEWRRRRWTRDVERKTLR